jgi:alpha-glucosidase
MNGTQPKNIQIPLKFLKSALNVPALVMMQNNTGSLKTGSSTAKPTDVLSLNLGVGGGYIGRYTIQ